MRYRLLATYQGAPYEAGIGPDEAGVVLFAACPPPEDLRFEPATGHWRKRVSRFEIQALYESRPVGMFRGERCVVLDDLSDRLHIAYLGHDAYRAEQLGYWEVDRGVFELIAPRHEVTDVVELRMPIASHGQHPDYGLEVANGSRPDLPKLSPLGPLPGQHGVRPVPAVDGPPLPLEAQALRAASAAARKGNKNQPDPAVTADADGPDVPGADLASTPEAPGQRPNSHVPAGLSEPSSAPSHVADPSGEVPSWTPQSRRADHPHRADPHRADPLRADPPRAEPPRAEPPRAEPPRAEPPRAEPGRAESTDAEPHGPDTGLSAIPRPRPGSSGSAHWLADDNERSPEYGRPTPAAPDPARGAVGAGAFSASGRAAAEAGSAAAGTGAATAETETGRAPQRRRTTRRRLPTQRIFSELAAQAGIPAGAYAIDEDVDGAMCLVRTDDGFEVFNSLAGARHEVRIFEDEESAYFYLFGVLVAEALRNGILAPRREPGLQVR
jgi:hypothetical protein